MKKCYFCKEEGKTYKGQMATDRTGNDMVLFVEICDNCINNVMDVCKEAENAECAHEQLRVINDSYQCVYCKKTFKLEEEVSDAETL